jgi:hypothetical protein
MLTVFAGLFFVQSVVVQYNNLMFLLFLCILLFNLYFLVSWFFRFGDVILRQQMNLFRRLPICMCLKRMEVADYDGDLQKVITGQDNERRKSRVAL